MGSDAFTGVLGLQTKPPGRVYGEEVFAAVRAKSRAGATRPVCGLAWADRPDDRLAAWMVLLGKTTVVPTSAGCKHRQFGPDSPP